MLASKNYINLIKCPIQFLPEHALGETERDESLKRRRSGTWIGSDEHFIGTSEKKAA